MAKAKSTGKKIGYRLKKNLLKTKDAVPYLADVVPVGTANLDTILADVAESLNITKASARFCFDAMFELIHEELAKGNKIETPFGLMEPAISGSFDAEDAPFDPKRNKVYVKVTPPKAIRDALKKIVPERLDAPPVPLEIAAVVTSALGKTGYNAVSPGETFEVSGQGFSDAVQVAIVDKKGVRREVSVEAAKDTLIICGAAPAAAKGVATLEASVDDSACASGRFTATRRVKVCWRILAGDRIKQVRPILYARFSFRRTNYTQKTWRSPKGLMSFAKAERIGEGGLSRSATWVVAAARADSVEYRP